MTELLNDIGHGINTYPPNKGVPDLPEFEFNNTVGQETKRLLSGLVSTYEAQPFNGKEVPLRTRTDLYNARYVKSQKAIGISNHANANNKSNVRGFGVFYWHDSPEAKRLAGIILDEYTKEFPDREKYPIWGNGLFPCVPNTWTDFHMCRETDGVFVLVEWEFMTNPEALKLLKSDDYRKRCALVNAKAVCRWYGIEWPKKTVQSASVQPTEKEWKVVKVASPKYGLYSVPGTKWKEVTDPFVGWTFVARYKQIVKGQLWYELYLGDTSYGWISSILVEEVKYRWALTKEDTTGYLHPDFKYVAGSIPSGSKIAIIDEQQDKYLVVSSNRPQWVKKKIVQL